MSRIFQTASQWNALLLLDEADVFLQQRSTLSLERNRLVAIFLRKLEYFDGILFLTTNHVADFDGAVLNRIHLVLKYDDLDHDARRNVLAHFLEKADQGGQDISDEEIDRLATIKLNGRQVSLHHNYAKQALTSDMIQIKNTVAIAHALAAWKNAPVSYSCIKQALKANGYSARDFSGLDSSDTLYED